MKNVLKPLAKSLLIPLGLATAASGTDAAILKNIFRSGITTSVVLNKEMDDIKKIIKPLEKSGLLIKRFSKTFKIEAKEQKYEFFGLFLGTLRAILLGNLLTDKGVEQPKYLDKE